MVIKQVLLGVVGNDRLKWETTETFDLGVDGSLFDNRLTFEFAFIGKRIQRTFVLDVPTAPTMGVPGNSYSDNIGKINNSGIELTVGGYIVTNRDFKWKADLNFL